MRGLTGVRVPAARSGRSSPVSPWPAVVAPGAVDLATVPALRARLEAALARRPAGLHVDLSGCTSVDDAVVDLLLSVRDAARRDGVVLVLVRPSPPVRRLLRLRGLDDAFALG